ncbi:MAG: hypothetical protein OFPI_34000 [Osedax symbiont Rs2]|nr:MAG: hypothetical protein OFPI_34000 [Osedax symbiont Rs2]
MLSQLKCLILGLVLLLESSTAMSYASEGKLVIAFSELPPWKVFNNNKFEGAYAALAREIAKRLNMQPKFELCSLKRCLFMMQVGHADIIIGVKNTLERQQYIEFLNTPYRASSAKVFYTLRNSRYAPDKYQDLYAVPSIGTKIGAKYFPRFDRDDSLKKVPAPNNKQNFSKLVRHKIDLILIAEDQGEFLIHQLKLRDQLKKANFYYRDQSPRYVGLSKKSINFSKLERIQTAMTEIKKSGTLRQIMLDNFFVPYNIATDQFHWE